MKGARLCYEKEACLQRIHLLTKRVHAYALNVAGIKVWRLFIFIEFLCTLLTFRVVQNIGR